MTDSEQSGGTDRTRIRRNARRAEYDLDQIKAVLDANQICHVAYVEDGEPRIIPTLYMRRDDYLYLHGNRQAAVLRYLAEGGLEATHAGIRRYENTRRPEDRIDEIAGFQLELLQVAGGPGAYGRFIDLGGRLGQGGHGARPLGRRRACAQL